MLDSSQISMTAIAGVFDESTDCVKLIDRDARLVWMNRGGLCTMEIADFSLVDGAYWPGFWPDDTRERIEAVLRKDDPAPAHFTAACDTAKGTPKWWDVSVVPVNDVFDRHVGFIATSRDVTEREREAQSREVLVQELRHRQGNTLTLASTLMMMHAAGKPELAAFADDMNLRFAALGRAQAVLARRDDGKDRFDLGSLISMLVGPMAGPDCVLDLEMEPDLSLDVDQVDTVAMILSELAVNAVKHGAFSRGGRVAIRTARDADKLDILWIETSDAPLQATARDGGSGTALMQRVAQIHDAALDIEWRDFGHQARLSLAA